MKRIVRVSLVWDVEVDAEYGDTDEALCAKAITAVPDGVTPSTNLLPAES